MLQHGPRSAPPYLRPLKKKGFKEERVTAIRLYDMGKSTTLESNKSLSANFDPLPQILRHPALAWPSQLSVRSHGYLPMQCIFFFP